MFDLAQPVVMYVFMSLVMFPLIQTQFVNPLVIQESNACMCVCLCLYVSSNTKIFHLSICDLRYGLDPCSNACLCACGYVSRNTNTVRQPISYSRKQSLHVCVCLCLYVSINTKTFHLSICDLRY